MDFIRKQDGHRHRTIERAAAVAMEIIDQSSTFMCMLIIINNNIFVKEIRKLFVSRIELLSIYSKT